MATQNETKFDKKKIFKLDIMYNKSFRKKCCSFYFNAYLLNKSWTSFPDPPPIPPSSPLELFFRRRSDGGLFAGKGGETPPFLSHWLFVLLAAVVKLGSDLERSWDIDTSSTFGKSLLSPKKIQIQINLLKSYTL